MRWSRDSVEHLGERIAILRSDEGHEVWTDFEWLDRKQNAQGEYVGAMQKRKFVMLRDPRGREQECDGLADAKRKAGA